MQADTAKDHSRRLQVAACDQRRTEVWPLSTLAPGECYAVTVRRALGAASAPCQAVGAPGTEVPGRTLVQSLLTGEDGAGSIPF